MPSAPTRGLKVPSDGAELNGMTAGTLEDRVGGRTRTFSRVDFSSAKQGAAPFRRTQRIHRLFGNTARKK